jgi:SagB-type dehydrogenase family enzyme
VQPDAGAPPPDFRLQLWSFRDDVAIEVDRGGCLTVLTRWGDVQVPDASSGVEDFLHRMTYGPVALGNAVDLDPKDLYETLSKLPGCVVHSLALRDASSPLLSVVPVSPRGIFDLPDQAVLTDSHPIRLSRFAFIREKEDELLLESPLAHHHVVLHRPLASWVVGSLGRATTSTEVARGANLSRPLVLEIVAYLAGAGMVLLGEENGNGDENGGAPTFAEDADPALLTWSPHDLLFHSRSRLGRHDNPAGAAFNLISSMAPLPVVKPLPDGPRHPLPHPDLATHDMSLTEAVEHRHSVRVFADEGPSAEQLGELLFRTARIRTQYEASGAGDVRYMVSERPYPSAGSLYELDLYLTIGRCADLPRGIYHYDPAGHALTLINQFESDIEELLAGATVLIGSSKPPVLITMTARIGRLSWVYDSIAYATTLKHVGVLQQTMYLVATMLGLAPCALAMGDSELATTAFGLDWPAEVSVGEFVVGLPGHATELPGNARESLGDKGDAHPDSA